ncbi:DNA-binding protein [Apibacter muscae]|uniref:DNA-binding protein n=1 Tax=Apibacter muscae TaxID=2509004 RepID=UPI0011AD94C0|nr:DNA-binding protein [Apibacter muscae]TWP31333.1 DNA-binding protein [Apibacter muscae]
MKLSRILEGCHQGDIQELVRIMNLNVVLKKEVLTIKEAALYTGYEESYLRKLNSQSTNLPSYSCENGNKLFFKRTELDTWMTKRRKNNFIEHQKEVDAYFSRKSA